MIFYSLLIFIASMILLIKGADLFVDEAARIARLLGISGFIIGLTLVSIGTSLPELATSILASVYNQSALVVGNLIGSNIANIGLVLGIAAIMTTILLKKDEYLKDSLFLMAIFILFFILALDGTISSAEGIIFLLIFLIYMYKLLKRKPVRGEETLKKFLKEYVHPVNGKLNLKNYEQAIDQGINYRICSYLQRNGIDVKEDFKNKLLHDVYKKLFYCVIGLVAIFFGAKYLVTSAIDIAMFFLISPEIIGITAIAIGTSLPELFVTFTSAKKGMSSILIGNLIGSGITNILLVGGVAAIIIPLTITTTDLFFYLPVMLFMGLAFIQFVRSKWISKVFQGILLLLFYLTFLFFTVIFQVV
jgi:cation:H+ antiporter